MSDGLPRLLWSTEELAAMGRCTECAWHPKFQGHHDYCPNNEAQRKADS